MMFAANVKAGIILMERCAIDRNQLQRALAKARFPFKRNRLRRVRCVNENRLRLLRENFTQQTQAPANRNARSKQWQP